MLTSSLWLLLILFIVFSVGWFYSFQVKIFAWIDFLWSASFLLALPLLAFLIPGEMGASHYLLMGMISLWSLRLSSHLVSRIAEGGEDRRYEAIKKKWKVWYGLFFYLLYIVEAALVVILTIPLQIISHPQIGFFQWLGLGIFLLSIGGEILADSQLKGFLKDRTDPNEVCKRGLWRYSRHPNYFFETMIWFSYGIYTIDQEYGYLGFIPYAIMFFLITKVTGIPPAEESSLESKPDSYRAYQKETNKFFPWFTKAIVIISFLLISNEGSLMASSSVDRSNPEVVKIEKVFNDLRANNLEILDDFYDKETLFVDPLGEHRGLDSVKDYYKNLYKNVESIRFEFSNSISQNSQHYMVWKMYLKASGLKGGEEIVLNGGSLIKFNEKGLVSYHRDYFDMGEFIYEHIPGLSWIISIVKNRLKAK